MKSKEHAPDVLGWNQDRVGNFEKKLELGESSIARIREFAFNGVDKKGVIIDFNKDANMDAPHLCKALEFSKKTNSAQLLEENPMLIFNNVKEKGVSVLYQVSADSGNYEQGFHIDNDPNRIEMFGEFAPYFAFYMPNFNQADIGSEPTLFAPTAEVKKIEKKILPQFLREYWRNSNTLIDEIKYRLLKHTSKEELEKILYDSTREAELQTLLSGVDFDFGRNEMFQEEKAIVRNSLGNLVYEHYYTPGQFLLFDELTFSHAKGLPSTEKGTGTQRPWYFDRPQMRQMAQETMPGGFKLPY